MTTTTKRAAIYAPFLFLVLALASACSPAGAPSDETAHTELINDQAQVVGSAKFTETDGGVKMQLTVDNLPPGSYTAQVHEVGVCEGPGFLSSGAPYPPPEEIAMVESVATTRGRSVAQFQMVGGVVNVEAVIPVVTLRPGNNSLFHPGGTSLIIDNVSPTGVYEGRIACGVITKTPEHLVDDLPQGDLESARQPDNLGTPGKEYQRPKAGQ